MLARLALAVLLFAGCAPPITARMRSSPQWVGGRFENPPAWPRRHGLLGYLQVRLRPGAPGRPRNYRPAFVLNDGAALRDNHRDVTLTWIGHNTMLLQGGGLSILSDPVFSERVQGFRRTAPPGVEGWLLPPIDIVVITHSHYDHLDEDSIRALGPRPTYVVPLGLGYWFTRRGLPHVVELDWWQRTELRTSDGRVASITMVPAQHWSRRGLCDENRSLWGGYVIDAGGHRFYVAGDSGYPAAFTEIGRRFPNLDYAILPIGSYGPPWFNGPQHMDPEEAVQAFRELGARWMVPTHWGTFHLGEEPMDEPPRRLHAAIGPLAGHLLELAIGQTWSEPAP